MLDVRRLPILQAVVRHGSLTAAAGALRYTTSAVSQQIAALEREVGTPLLIRGPGGARPTVAGEKLLEHAARILGAVDFAEQDLQRIATAGPDVIRLASFSSAASALLPKAIGRFRDAYPTTEVRLVSADPEDGVALLGTSGVDAAVVTEVPGDGPEFPGLYTAPVYDDEFLVVLPLHHRLATLREVQLEKLADENWIVSSASGICPDTKVFRNACAEAGFDPMVTYRSDDYQTVQGLVAANLGVSMVPSLAAGTARGDVAVRRVARRRLVRRVSLALTEPPPAGSALGSLVSLVQHVGTTLGTDRAYSVAERPLNIA
ncbi:LysR family transcriptional regulator [Williamsia sterculiae]|uniref:DNA-binding transcriptional regulator, LysR family n=1 Tax=Williamsia sterculiae TaxID=1344003 RepID=A0A1N7FD85_9NOCA|nr:LysR family transcriptional regulator [Williamsia sterculiae]SIR98272.1 DNA-binding transcriptional regulator, LysR family [Williamsia sterculiae]